MRRKIVPRNAAETRSRPNHRRGGADVPEVPIFQPNAPCAAPPSPAPSATVDDSVEDAIRRMVEAAYT